MQLAVDVADNDDIASGVRWVDGQAVGLLVEDVGGGEEEALEAVGGEDRGEGGRREVAGRVVEGGGKVLDPLEG